MTTPHRRTRPLSLLLPVLLAPSASPWLLPAIAPMVASAAHAQTVVRLVPSADATTDQSQPNSNFGSDAELSFGKNFSSNPFTVWFLRGHLRFDLTPLVGLGIPARATLSWYQSRASAAGCLDVTLHRVTQPWSEASVTWASNPAHDATALASACVGANTGTGWKEFDVTTLVRDWLAGTHQNHGMVVRDPSEHTAGAARPGFGHSRESAQTTLRPFLEVEFAARFGAGCALHPVAPGLAFAGGRAVVGGSFDVTAAPMVPGTGPGMLFGTSNTQWAGGALPFVLTGAGFPYCSMLVSPDLAVSFATLTGARFDLAIPLPGDAALRGAVLYMQALGWSPSTQLYMTDGLAVTIR